jgi:hypothetical protein
LPKHLSSLVVKGAAGFFIAFAAWLWVSPPYTRLLASLSEAAIHLAERPSVTSITPAGTLMMVDRIDFPTSPSGRMAVESTDITFNFILLTTLFAASSRPLSDRNVFGFAVAAVVLLFVHVAAVVAFVKAYYASGFGSWSALHYGVVARSFWGVAPYFYSVVGVYASAFALWWLFRPPAESMQGAPRRRIRRA